MIKLETHWFWRFVDNGVLNKDSDTDNKSTCRCMGCIVFTVENCIDQICGPYSHEKIQFLHEIHRLAAAHPGDWHSAGYLDWLYGTWYSLSSVLQSHVISSNVCLKMIKGGCLFRIQSDKSTSWRLHFDLTNLAVSLFGVHHSSQSFQIILSGLPLRAHTRNCWLLGSEIWNWGPKWGTQSWNNIFYTPLVTSNKQPFLDP